MLKRFGRSRRHSSKKKKDVERIEEVERYTEGSVTEVRKNMDENHYLFAYPELKDGMSDHILQHKRGKNFEYAALVEGEPEGRETLLSRLRSHRPSGGKTDTNVNGMPPIELKGSVHYLQLSEASDFLSNKKKKFSYSRRFILVHEILITFVPLISFGDKFSAFKVALIDNRKIEDPVVRSYLGNTNISCNASASLDYCICVDDIRDMALAFVCPQPTLKEGKTWAVVNVNLALKQLDFPIQTYVKPTFAVFQIPHSAMNDNDSDPRHFMGTLQEADLEALKSIKARGEMTDTSKPVVRTMEKSALAGTAYSGKPKIKSALKTVVVDDVSEGSVSTGYFPKEDGEGDDEETPAIKRMKQDALNYQREMNDLANSQGVKDSNEEQKDDLKPQNQNERVKKSARFKSPPPSSGTLDAGDEELP